MPIRPWLAWLLVIGAGATGVWLLRRPADPPPGPDQVMQAGAGLTWYRGNMHTHSLWSDGDSYPEMVVDWYARHGYQFLVLTDHNSGQEGERWINPAAKPSGALALQVLKQRFPGTQDTRDVAGVREVRLRTFPALSAASARAGQFLLVRGDEVSDFAGPVSVHMSALNLPQAYPPVGGNDVNTVIAADVAAADAVASQYRQPVLLQLNHPNFLYAITAEQLMRLTATNLFEVYNGHPLSNNPGDGQHPSTERLWDIALAWRTGVLGLPLLYGTATDDSHQFLHVPSGDADPGRGWVMVLADALTPERLLAALHAGRFYASTGVAIRRIVTTSDRMEVDIDAQPGVDYRIEFIGTRAGFDRHSLPPRSATGFPLYASRSYSDQIGEVLLREDDAHAVYRFRPDDLYVRARITASRPHPNPSQSLQYQQAWVQPVAGPAARTRAESGATVPPSTAVALAADSVTGAFQPLPAARVAALHTAASTRCSLDRLADAAGTPAQVLLRNSTVVLSGWIMSPDSASVPPTFATLLVGNHTYVAEAWTGRRRPDLATALGEPALEAAGFIVEFQLQHVVPGQYRIALAGFESGQASLCWTGKSVRIQ